MAHITVIFFEFLPMHLQDYLSDAFIHTNNIFTLARCTSITKMIFIFTTFYHNYEKGKKFLSKACEREIGSRQSKGGNVENREKIEGRCKKVQIAKT